MVADSKALKDSAIAQWEVLKELIGKELPETGRIDFVKNLFGVDNTTALEIVSFISRIEEDATDEAKKLQEDAEKGVRN